MTLDRKILGGFIACCLILLVVAVLSFRNSEKFMKTSQWVTHTQLVLFEFEQILLGTVDAETAVRGFAISEKERFLDTYNDSKKKVLEHTLKARQLTQDNTIQQANIDLLEDLSARRIAHLERCIDLGRSGAADKARESITAGEGKRLQDQIRRLVEKASQIEQELLKKRRAESENDADNFNTLFVVLMIIILLVLIVVYLLISTNLRALRKAEAEVKIQNWNLAGSSEVVKRTLGNKNVAELSQIIINTIASYLDVPIGGIYIVEKNSQQLTLSGKYAVDKKKLDSVTVRFGQGIVGQCAIEKKMKMIQDIDPHYMDIASTFGNIKPKNILAVPFLFESNVIGVIELGAIKDFTEQQKQFLQIVADSVAIAITSAHAREEAKELFEEIQRQAEELEEQQNELKQTNEELQTKTDLLQHSENILKNQQEELQLANVELEEKAGILEEQKAELEAAKTEIEKRAKEIAKTSKYKSEFLANMSHELRTPLNSILILSQLLAENKNDRLSPKEVEHASNINNSGNDLLNLINEILDLSKVEAGKMQLEISDVPIKEVADNITSMFKEVAKSRSIQFNIDCHQEVSQAVITSDKQRIEQILRNLLSNAFKFTSKGGKIKVFIGYAVTEKKSFRNPNLAEAAAVLSFSVCDTGVGISKDKREIIFEAFQQADGSTKRKYGGTGLGLSISRELAHVLGGEIQLESEEGKGSTFTLFLPTAFDAQGIPDSDKKWEIRYDQPAEIQIDKRSDDFKTSINGEQIAVDDRDVIKENDRIILIIEDDEKFATMLLDFVRERRYKGIIATQGSTGISYARHYKPDAILLDMKLPVMDGREVLKHFKNDPDLRHIPVQIISGYDHKKEILAQGAFDYLQKPIKVNDLQNVFDKIEKFTSNKLKRLLIIEDNRQQNNAIRELIGNGDVKSFSAYSGIEAQEMLMREPFDCIIVDLGLPDMSGFDLLEKIKADKKLNRIPVIVYTGRDLKIEDSARLRKLADTVVLKTANSHERLLDETTLFLHRVQSKLPKEKQSIIHKLHRIDEVLKDKVVLIVDDDIRNIYSLTNALDEEGISCLTAENGKAALEMLERHDSINLVLMDIMMPVMDGFEATVAIREIEKFKKLPIIALTAKAMKGDKEKCLAVGMSDYIAKPVNMDRLLSLLRVWLYK